MLNDPAATVQRSRRLAAIDVGTNSLRLIVVEAEPDGSYKLIDDEKAITRLGKGLGETKRLAKDTMEDSAVTIARMKGIAQGYGVEQLRVVGTAACREAINREEFIELVRERAGVELEVISAEEEARLAYSSVDYAFDLSSANVAVVDIGGGSTEIVLSSGGVIEKVATLPLGAVRLTEKFGAGDDHAGGGDKRGYKAMRRHIEAMIDERFGKAPFVPQIMFGTGGTFTTLASVSMHKGESRNAADVLPFTVRGYEMQRSDVKHTLDMLRATPVRARTRIPGLSPDRAEIIVAGLAIAERVMKRLGVNGLRVHDRGIRDGIILAMIREIFPQASADGSVLAHDPHDRLRCARQFGTSCRYEELHSNHVARLSVRLFDQLAAYMKGNRQWATPDARELLEAAAILHDVGYFINYARHHKHSYHMIIHSDLQGFTHREREIVANVARYHRRSVPKKRHANFAALAEGDRELVKRLAAVLRVADGLDRRHVQGVRSLDVVPQRGRLQIVVNAEEDPSVDLWGAERKKDLFEEVFDTRLEFAWANRPIAAVPEADRSGKADGSATPPMTRRQRAAARLAESKPRRRLSRT